MKIQKVFITYYCGSCDDSGWVRKFLQDDYKICSCCEGSGGICYGPDGRVYGEVLPKPTIKKGWRTRLRKVILTDREQEGSEK